MAVAHCFAASCLLVAAQCTKTICTLKSTKAIAHLVHLTHLTADFAPLLPLMLPQGPVAL
jgi:hypothetical protein